MVDNISSFYDADKFIKNEKPEWITKEDLNKLEKKANTYLEIEKSTKNIVCY